MNKHANTALIENKNLKYKVKEKFDALRFNERGEKIKAFAENAGITTRTLYNYFDIEIGSNKDIPAEILFKLANFFDCPIEDLVNYETENTQLQVQA